MLNIIFGVIATFLAVGGIWATIWVTRKYRNSNKTGAVRRIICPYTFKSHLFNGVELEHHHHANHPPADVELGLLHHTSPTPTTNENESENRTPLLPVPDAEDDRHKVHEVIGDALELFSRHLRAHN